MRRLARILVPLGIIGVVLGLSKLHALRHAYSFTGSSRLGWALVYMGLLWMAAYALGIPDLGRRRTLWLSVFAASALGALTISVAQLFVGDALLPRFVVFGSSRLREHARREIRRQNACPRSVRRNPLLRNQHRERIRLFA